MDSDDAICINTNFIKFSDSVGAVALPDGRVLICGGEMLEKKDDWVGKEFLYIFETFVYYWLFCEEIDSSSSLIPT